MEHARQKKNDHWLTPNRKMKSEFYLLQIAYLYKALLFISKLCPFRQVAKKTIV